MIHLEQVPLWAAIPIALLVIAGGSLALIGSYGLMRIQSFYDRLHAPTLGSSWGTGAIVLASMALFSIVGSRLVVHEILVAMFITVTTPTTLMLLGRAALHRDRHTKNPGLPDRARKPD